MNPTLSRAWGFGGPLTDVPPETAWLLLAGIAALFAVLAWLSYRTAVARVAVAPAALLVALRCGAVLALIYCMANPVLVERVTREPPPPPPAPPPPPLVVVVDRSDSMTIPDNRGRTRLDSALTTWRRIDQATADLLGERRYHSIAADIQVATTLEEALERHEGTGETHLFRSLAALIGQLGEPKPAGVVVLTDGIDTSGESEDRLREAVVAAGVPLYFVPGVNRGERPEPFVRVREWRVPGTAQVSTVFTAEATFEAFSRADRAVSYSLWQGGMRISQGRLALTTGSNVIVRSFTVNASQPGPLELTVRLGETEGSPAAARSITRVLARRPIRVVVHQGALDWGFRYLTAALRTDSNFEFVTIVTPDAGVSIVREGAAGLRVVGRLAEDVKALAAFDCIILSETRPEQLTAGQQRALETFARGGGSVVYLAPMSETATPVQAGPLLDLLPVVFADDVLPRPLGATLGELAALSLTEAGLDSPIFALGGRTGAVIPRFSEFVPVSRLRAGATALARHPRVRDPETGAPCVLLATHTYGRGRVTFLGTDALWRWKLAEPASSTAVETFWQQLILAVGRRREPDTLRFLNAPAQVQVGQSVSLLLDGAGSDQQPVVAARSPHGVEIPLTATAVPEPGTGWRIAWEPAEPGAWEVAAVVAGAHRAHIFPTVLAEVTGERARTPPALEAMRALAGDTGGALLTHEPPASWRPAAAAQTDLEPVEVEYRKPLWNRWAVLWVALGCFGVELVLRRLWKLL